MGGHSQLTESSQELVLSDVLVLGDIEILEHWLQVDPLDLDSGSVFFHDIADHLLLLWSHVEVLSSGGNSVVHGHRCDLSQWSLLDAVGSEGAIDVVAEVSVVKEGVWAVHGAGIEL